MQLKSSTMIKIVIFVGISLLSLSCRAQFPTLPIQQHYKGQDGAYYKDINNELDDFEGTWLYINGNTSLKIILRKEVMFYNGDYYEDVMVGEYRYIENGVELVNTLDNINVTNVYEHNIYGQDLYYNCALLPVSDCIDGEVRLSISLFDVNDIHGADFFLHKRIVNGHEALRVFYAFEYPKAIPEGSTMPDPTLPWQDEIIMIKQD